MREHTITATRNPSSKSPRPRAIGHMPSSSSRSIRFHALLWPVGEIATLVSAARQAENTRGRGCRLTSGRDVVGLAGSRGSSTPPSSDPRLGHVSVLCRRESSPIPCSVCCVFSASDHAARARSVRGRGTPSDHDPRTDGHMVVDQLTSAPIGLLTRAGGTESVESDSLIGYCQGFIPGAKPPSRSTLTRTSRRFSPG